jgi:hypothetical protein
VIGDKVQELDHLDKNKEKIKRKCKWNMQELWENIKRSNLGIMHTGDEKQYKAYSIK